MEVEVAGGDGESAQIWGSAALSSKTEHKVAQPQNAVTDWELVLFSNHSFNFSRFFCCLKSSHSFHLFASGFIIVYFLYNWCFHTIFPHHGYEIYLYAIFFASKKGSSY